MHIKVRIEPIQNGKGGGTMKAKMVGMLAMMFANNTLLGRKTWFVWSQTYW